jgi:hypothetical protein
LTRVALALGIERGPYEPYQLLQERVSPMLFDPFRDLTAEDAAPWLKRRLQRFFDGYAQEAGCPVFMHKFTGWPRARLLAAVFPQAKFVHIVRDGRSVANSLMQVRWWPGYRGTPAWTFGHLSEEERTAWEATGHSWTYIAGLEWNRLMTAFEVARAEIGPERWLDVRYEDLVMRPKEETRAILHFVGLDLWGGFDKALSRLGVSPERTDAYRDELRPEDVALLESLFASTLMRWGYPSPNGHQAVRDGGKPGRPVAPSPS